VLRLRHRLLFLSRSLVYLAAICIPPFVAGSATTIAIRALQSGQKGIGALALLVVLVCATLWLLLGPAWYRAWRNNVAGLVHDGRRQAGAARAHWNKSTYTPDPNDDDKGPTGESSGGKP
jgi:hypothetical protein